MLLENRRRREPAFRLSVLPHTTVMMVARQFRKTSAGQYVITCRTQPYNMPIDICVGRWSSLSIWWQSVRDLLCDRHWVRCGRYWPRLCRGQFCREPSVCSTRPKRYSGIARGGMFWQVQNTFPRSKPAVPGRKLAGLARRWRTARLFFWPLICMTISIHSTGVFHLQQAACAADDNADITSDN